MNGVHGTDGLRTTWSAGLAPLLGGVVLAAVLVGARPAAAVAVSGTPSCGPSGSVFECDIQFSSVSTLLVEDQPFEVDIVLENMQALELFDDDTAQDTFFITLGLDNTGNPDLVNIRFDIAFSDETGAILDPPGEQLGFFFVNVAGGDSRTGTTSIGFDLGALTPLLFHDVHLTLTPTGDIQLTSLTRIGFSGIDDSSKVVPEPGTAGLLGAGLLALACRRRATAR